jgi:hypothetical protein
VPKPYLFSLLGLASSEKQIPQVIENIEKWSESMEALERVGVLRRQMLYPAELRARRDYFLHSMYLTQHLITTHYGCNWVQQRAYRLNLSQEAQTQAPRLPHTIAGMPHHF